jgi:protocatechuate 3,4-dioxygenase beta subunit
VAEQHAGEVSWDDISAHVDTAVSLLPDKLRLPVVMHFYENRTQESIAQELGLSRSTVTYRIAKAVDGIRNTLRKRRVIVGIPLLAGLLGRHLAAEAAPQTLTLSLAKLALAGATVVPQAGLLGWFTFGGLGLKQAVVLGGLLLVLATVAVWKILPTVVPSDTPVPAATAKVTLRTPPVGPPLEQPKAKAAQTPAFIPPSEAAAPEKSMVTPCIAGRAYIQESGEPVSGLTVVLCPQDEPRGDDVTVVTGTEGRYRFEGVRQGAYKLNYAPQAGLPRPPNDGMQEEVTVVRVKADQVIDDADLAIRRGVRVRGRVVDEQGRPVQGAHVEGRDRTDDRSLESFITQADGAFALAGFRQTASFTLEARFDHTERTLVGTMFGPVALGPEDLSDVQMTLGPGACLRGTVVDPDGNPVAGAVLRATPKAKVEVLQGAASTKTGVDGAFTLKNIAPGVNGLFAQVPEQSRGIILGPPWDALEMSAGQEIRDATIVLQIDGAEESLEIAGRVVDGAHKPVADVEVMVNGASASGNAWTPTEGTFRVKGLKPGPYRVNARTRLPGLHGEVTLEAVEAGTEGMEIVLPATGGVAGRVVDSTGAPVREFDLCWQDNRNRYVPGSDRNFVHQRSEDGSFELKGIEPGPCTVIAKATGYSPASVEVPLISSGETVRGVTVRLEQEATLAGVVVDKEGVPVANAGVIPGEAPQSEAPENAVAAHTGPDGTFRLTGLAPDLKLVTVYHPDYAIVSTPVTLRAGQESTVNVVLTQGGVIEGTVYLDHQPWSGRELRLNAGRAENMFGVTAKTSESGAYRFEKVRIGSARVILFAPTSMEVSSRDHRVQCKVVNVFGDKTTTADFHFSSCTARMEGVITLNGVPVSAAHAGLALEVSLPDGMEQYNARLDADGTYRFPCIVDGAALLKVWTRLADPAPAPVEVSIVPGETLHQDIELGARPAE